MHDPNTLAFELKNPFVRPDKHGYRPALLTIWHHDPAKRGDDDSCGRFIRARHLDQAMLEKVKKDIAFEYDYLFNQQTGYPVYSVIATTVALFQRTAWTILIYEAGGKIPKGDPLTKFMRTHLYEIIQFAENPVDSLYAAVTNKYAEGKERRIGEFVSIIAPFVMRMKRPWYKHPRWHIHHWQFQFHPWQNVKRRYWDRCSMCGKRGFTGPAYSDWNGTKRWCQRCEQKRYVNQQPTSLN